MENNFIKASRLKLRFSVGRGDVSVEDLWDLSLNSLDTVAKAVNKQLKQEDGEESFIPTANKRKVATHNDLRLEILKYIIGVKVEEQNASKARAEKVARLSQLRELAANKQLEAFAAQSLEDVEKQIAELEAETAATASA